MIQDEKQQLRRRQKAAFGALDRCLRRQADEKICKKLLSLPSYQKAKTVFCFVPMQDEVDVTPFLQAVLQSGRRLAVPLCLEQGQMEAREITGLSQLQAGAYGILEPPRQAAVVLPQEIDFAVIPGLGFDADGGRLGRGGGYYDRYLDKISGSTVGVTYQQLLLPCAAFSAWDRRVQGVCTEQKLYK